MSSVPAPPDNLVSIDRISTLDEYLRELWERRDYLLVIPRHDARAKQMTTLLGQAWHLLNPLLMTLVYYVVFGLILDARRGVDYFIAYLAVGVLIFQLIQRITQDAAGAMAKQEGLIRTIRFPRALLPLSILIEHVVAFVPTLAVIYVVAIANGAPLEPRMLLLPLTLVPVIALAGGMAFLAARLGSVLPDIREILPHAFRILLYFSGVLFSIDALVGNQLAKNALRLNPIYDVITLSRWSVLGEPIGERVLVALVVWCTVLPVVGLLWFRAAERRYGA